MWSNRTAKPPSDLWGRPLETKRKRIVPLVLVVGSYLALAATVVYIARSGVLTPEEALLTLVCLFGLYVGFGVLIVVYRLINKLE